MVHFQVDAPALHEDCLLSRPIDLFLLKNVHDCLSYSYDSLHRILGICLFGI